jgi:hypothetical protein
VRKSRCEYLYLRKESATRKLFLMVAIAVAMVLGCGAGAAELPNSRPNTNHFGRNATDKVSKTLVIRVKAKDKPVMTEVK